VTFCEGRSQGSGGTQPAASARDNCYFAIWLTARASFQATWFSGSRFSENLYMSRVRCQLKMLNQKQVQIG